MADAIMFCDKNKMELVYSYVVQQDTNSINEQFTSDVIEKLKNAYYIVLIASMNISEDPPKSNKKATIRLGNEWDSPWVLNGGSTNLNVIPNGSSQYEKFQNFRCDMFVCGNSELINDFADRYISFNVSNSYGEFTSINSEVRTSCFNTNTVNGLIITPSESGVNSIAEGSKIYIYAK